ncbi:MAG: hypothetical protein WBP66_02465 [Azonexus sp.]
MSQPPFDSARAQQRPAHCLAPAFQAARRCGFLRGAVDRKKGRKSLAGAAMLPIGLMAAPWRWPFINW